MRLTVPVLRDLVMLAIGSAGMTKELFFLGGERPDMLRVGLCIGLLLGPAALNSLWRGRSLQGDSTSTGVSPSPSRSPSRRRGS